MNYLLKIFNFKNILGLVKFFHIIKNKISVLSLIVGNSVILKLKDHNIIFSFHVRDIYDLSILYEIFYSRVYPIKPTLEKITIIDCGTHVGYFSIYAKKLCPNAKIIGYEAGINTYNMLLKNIEINNLSLNEDFQFYNKGISGKKGTMTYYEYENTADNGFIKYKHMRPFNSLEVNVIDFNSVVNKIEFIDILKMDIEGSEYSIFEKFNSFNKIGRLRIELHPYPNYDILSRQVDEFGKHYNHIIQNGILYYLCNK